MHSPPQQGIGGRPTSADTKRGGIERLYDLGLQKVGAAQPTLVPGKLLQVGVGAVTSIPCTQFPCLSIPCAACLRSLPAQQKKRALPVPPDAASSLRLSEQDWSKVTGRLYRDAGAKQARMQKRRQDAAEQEAAAMRSRSRSASPLGRAAARLLHSLQADGGGGTVDGDFHSRQLALLQRRAALAALKRVSDEDDLQECTCGWQQHAWWGTLLPQPRGALRVAIESASILSLLLPPCACRVLLVHAVHPTINAGSRSLQRTVQQLHMWDARKRLTVYQRALDKAEAEDHEHSFAPRINTLSRKLGLAHYAASPDPARPWTASPKHAHAPAQPQRWASMSCVRRSHPHHAPITFPVKVRAHCHSDACLHASGPRVRAVSPAPSRCTCCVTRCRPRTCSQWRASAGTGRAMRMLPTCCSTPCVTPASPTT